MSLEMAAEVMVGHAYWPTATPRARYFRRAPGWRSAVSAARTRRPDRSARVPGGPRGAVLWCDHAPAPARRVLPDRGDQPLRLARPTPAPPGPQAGGLRPHPGHARPGRGLPAAAGRGR